MSNRFFPSFFFSYFIYFLFCMQLFSRCYDTRLTGCQIRHICYFVVSGPVVCETFLIYFVLVLTRSRSVRHNDDTVVYKQKHLSFISISDRTPSLFPRLPRGHSTQEQNSYSHISLPPTPIPIPIHTDTNHHNTHTFGFCFQFLDQIDWSSTRAHTPTITNLLR